MVDTARAEAFFDWLDNQPLDMDDEIKNLRSILVELTRLRAEAATLRKEKNDLVLKAYPAMDAVDRIRALIADAEYGNDLRTVAQIEKALAATPAPSPWRPVIDEIATERRRQVEKEGWSFKHDDAHEFGELAKAASCYAANAGFALSTPPRNWPWDPCWWKPKSRRQDLVRAAALIVAEIERLDRAEPPQGDAQ